MTRVTQRKFVKVRSLVCCTGSGVRELLWGRSFCKSCIRHRTVSLSTADKLGSISTLTSMDNTRTIIQYGKLSGPSQALAALSTKQ